MTNSDRHIFVVGAGHGGLVAAALLSTAGYDVTVFEKCTEEDIGHDWEDRFSFGLLAEIVDINESSIPSKFWRYRGDCAFVSPAKRKKVIINYDEENRQKIMWRKALIRILIQNAKAAGVRFVFDAEVTAPVIEDGKVRGIVCKGKELICDMLIDAAGVFSPIRTRLPKELHIERMPKKGDLFYAYRAYFDKTNGIDRPNVPFEVYMYHEGEQGLSWFNTNKESCDVLIGRIVPLTEEKIREQIEIFRADHPWLGKKLLHGGDCCVIPVRRPLTLMVAEGYAAVGDSAFMTTPMNGMGIDLSLNAGRLLAETIIQNQGDFSVNSLWDYNREFHIRYGAEASKNEGLKNAILSMPSKGVDFLFENGIIQSSDLAGAGKNTNLGNLLGKFARGMKSPGYFFALLNGLIKGSQAAKLYSRPPRYYDINEITGWDRLIRDKSLTDGLSK